MNGQVLEYSFEKESGIIAGSDGGHYTFTRFHWKAQETPSPGMRVDFNASGDRAVDIYPIAGAPGGARVGAKSKVTAGLLAIFLGVFLAHHFYLGHYKTAMVRLSLYPFVVMIGSPVNMKWYPAPFLVFAAIILGALALIEGIMYLVKSDEDFYRAYVANRKS